MFSTFKKTMANMIDCVICSVEFAILQKCVSPNHKCVFSLKVPFPL